MAIVESEVVETADVPGVTRPMTYEEYLASPEEMARYDILDGWKVYRLYGEAQLTNPTIRHQRIQSRILRAFEAYEDTSKKGLAIASPCDVLIRRRPTRTRQPDVLFISHERLTGRSLDDPAPLSPAPELVVEIVSPSDRPGVLAAKIANYQAVDVLEVWVVRTETRTVEVVRLSMDEIETVGAYGPGEVAVSVAFDGLTAVVDEVFAE